MAITHPTAIRNGLANYVVDSVDDGAGPGKLIFQTSADAEVATLAFSDPAFQDAANGTAVANAITPDTDATAGVIAKFKITDSDDVDKGFAGEVGTADSDIIMSSLNIGEGDQVQIKSLSYTAPP